jgi:phosphoglycerate dehydrogenase-like enzyme
MSLVVCLSFPLASERPEIEAMGALDPRIEVVTVPYMEEGARRNARHSMPIEELRATAPGLTAEQREAFRRAEVLLALDVPVDLAGMAPALRWLHVAGAGVEHLAGSGVRERGVLVTNSSGIAATSISEFVLARLLAVWKRFDEIAESQRAHQWVPTFGRTFAGSVVGIVGVGAIGSAVARRAKAFGATVLGVRRTAKPVSDVDEMYSPGMLHDMLGRCDAVVIAAPGGDETVRLFDAPALAAMKPGAVLCNVARGSLVDEGALVEALRSGHLRAAILDVFEEEPLPRESPLWDLPDCHVSPHCSVSLDRYADDVMELFLDNLGRYVRGEPLRNVV